MGDDRADGVCRAELRASGDSPTVTVLLIDDHPEDARRIKEMLVADRASSVLPPPRVVQARTLARAMERLREGDVDVALLELSLPDSGGLETLTTLHDRAPRCPIVVLSERLDEALATRAIRAGAQDYLVKGQVDGGTLSRSLRYAVERKRAEAERDQLARLQGARAEAAQAIHLRDEFLAAAAHELKTPLTVLKGTAQVARRLYERSSGIDPQRHLAALDNIDAAVNKITALVNSLLDTTRLQMGRPLELEPRPVDLVALVRRVADQQQVSHLHRLRVDLKGLTTPSDHDGATAGTGEPHLPGDWDEARLERVLDTLLGNAVKYSPHGGEVVVTLERSPASSRTVPEAIITVRDEGVGIAPADIPAIFERFYRGRNVIGKIDGTGVGLTVARQILEQHGGTLTVESQEGEGSVFTLRLPLHAPRSASGLSGQDAE